MSIITPMVRPMVRPMVTAMGKGGQRTPAQIIQGLFAAGQQGFWLPFTNFASLSQDSAGTLPYTALEQPVGRVLDKSRGLELGPEKAIVTGFTSAPVGGPSVSVYAAASLLTVGRTYLLSFTISDFVGSGDAGLDASSAGTQVRVSGNGSYTFRYSALADGAAFFSRDTNSYTCSGITFRELKGNHATQPTSTARGVVSARVNVFTETEFRGTGISTGSNFTYSSLDGYLGALRFTLNALDGGYAYKSGSVAAGLVCVFSVVVKMDDGSAPLTAAQNPSNDFMLVVNGGQAQAASTVPLGGGLYRLTTNPILINSGTIGIVKYPNNSAKPFTVTAYSLVPIAQASLPYQRVNTPTDYDAVGFPKYLRLDGTDDFYTCGGGGSTTGFYYSDVIRPTSTTYSALIADYTGSGGYLVERTNTGISFIANGGGTIRSVSLPLAANAQAFVAAFDDGVNLVLQVAGGQASTARPAVTAGSSTMYLGRYTTVAQYFSGTMTEPIYRAGPPPSAYERGVIRAYQMQKAGLL